MTPLICAVHYDHVNIALLLLEEGASPHAIAKNGYTPLHIAARKNQMDIATTLLEYTADPNAESKVSNSLTTFNPFISPRKKKILSSILLTFFIYLPIYFVGWLHPIAFSRTRRTYRYGGIVGSTSCQR